MAWHSGGIPLSERGHRRAEPRQNRNSATTGYHSSDTTLLFTASLTSFERLPSPSPCHAIPHSLPELRVEVEVRPAGPCRPESRVSPVQGRVHPVRTGTGGGCRVPSNSAGQAGDGGGACSHSAAACTGAATTGEAPKHVGGFGRVFGEQGPFCGQRRSGGRRGGPAACATTG